MDRRQRKTREAIFCALIDLLAEKEFSQITVEQIIRQADVGRATFYAHFETKDDLLKQLCQELFCHIFDALEEHKPDHRHIFSCDPPSSVFVHLLQHLLKNDNRILQLLSSRSSSLFLQYFRENLRHLVASQLPLFQARKSDRLPEDLWIDHISATFVETVLWWVDQGMTESPETVAEYFFLLV